MTGCPHCGSADSQVMDLLKAWKEIEELKDLLKKRPERIVTVAAPIVVPKEAKIDTQALAYTPQQGIVSKMMEDPMWQERYNAIKEAYIKTRLEVSGSFGNWSGDTRRRVLENELSAELGFKI